MYEINQFNQPTGIPMAGWQKAKYPAKTPLFGSYTMLEPFEIAKHCDQFFDALQIDNRGETWTYLFSDPIFNRDDFHVYMETKLQSPDTLFYAVIDTHTKRTLGIASYLRITPEHGVIEVGHLHFSKLLQRTRIATEAMYLMMYRAFEELGYRRYECKCNALNAPSRKAAERLGFTFEGIFRQALVIKNTNRDTAWYSIIDKEWPQIKKRLEAWLHPSNFDIQGNQKNRLIEIA